MRLLETFRYELVYQSRNVSTWFYFVLLLVLSFLMSAIFIDEPLAEGYFSNAPYIVTKVSLIAFFFLGLLTIAPFAGNAAARDLETRMHPLLYSSPIPKHIYLGGRFLAAFTLGAIVIIAIPIGVFLAGVFPIEHPELLGPINIWGYVSTYFLVLLPNTFFAVAFMFAVAVLKRKGMLSYLIATIVAILVIGSWQIIGQGQKNWSLAEMTDPLGLTIIQNLEKLWNVNQKNSMLPAFEISTLLNRLLWLAMSVGVLLLTYVGFKKSTISSKEKKAEKKRNAQTLAVENYGVDHSIEVTIPQALKSFDMSTRLLQISTITKESFRLIAFGWGWVALACMFLFVVLTGSMWFSDYYNIPEIPVTGHLLGYLENVSDHGIWLVIPLLIFYYAGELVWRERDSRLNDILGAAPLPVWVSFVGKFTGMVLALMVMQFVLMIAGIILQSSLGYYNFEIVVYLKVLFGLRLIDYVLFAVLAFALHVILNQKYLTHLICVLFYLFTMFGPEFGIESGLLLYGSGPGWSWSDLRGLDPFMGPWWLMKLYWISWAVLLAVFTTMLWPRGSEKQFIKRFRQSIGKDNRPVTALAGISLLMIITVGGYIHYSTHYLHPQTSSFEPLELMAAYEKLYSKYSNSPQPSIVKTKLQVEIYPEKGTAAFKGNYLLVNQSSNDIDTVFISTSPSAQNNKLSFSAALKAEKVDGQLNFRTYVLERALRPGDSIDFEFDIIYDPKGFPYNGMKTVVVENGTYFEDAWLPTIGYQHSRQIFSANDRKEQGLEAKTFLESDEESFAQQRVSLETIVGTDKGQIAVAPGKLLKTWTENDRSYFHYATENRVNNKIPFFSSNYETYKAQSKSDSGEVVDISILHHPEHTHNLERIAVGIQESFKYLNLALGKYPHSEIRFTEVPGYNKGLKAYPTNVFYREGFALLKPEEDPRGIDIVFATTAHEVAHQWWGHQVSPAPIKGAALITESLAWFSAFEIVEQTHGKDALLKLIDLAQDDYFTPQERSADPLLVANQTSLIYRKGPLAIYALREYIGKEQMARALKTFFTKYSAMKTARPVPSDLYRHLETVTPDSIQYLLHDLFATNTFWDLKTEKISVTEAHSGKWRVALDIDARKFTVDKKGTETDVEMNDWVQIGIDAESQDNDQRIYLQQHQIRSGKQTVVVEVDQKPSVGGIDPNYLLIDLKRWDNKMSVEKKSQ